MNCSSSQGQNNTHLCLSRTDRQLYLYTSYLLHKFSFHMMKISFVTFLQVQFDKLFKRNSVHNQQLCSKFGDGRKIFFFILFGTILIGILPLLNLHIYEYTIFKCFFKENICSLYIVLEEKGDLLKKMYTTVAL